MTTQDRAGDPAGVGARTHDPASDGLPPMAPSRRPVALHDRLPSWLFYLPFALWWLVLSVRYGHPTLPTGANPGFPLGGLTGESKADILSLPGRYARSFVADFVTATPATPDTLEAVLDRALRGLDAKGIGFPVVAKPSIGCRGTGVKLLRDQADLRRYLTDFPAGHTAVIQEFVPFEAEAGIFYLRHPDEAEGRIFSFTFKYFPKLTGDGDRTLRQLIERDPRARLFKHIYFPKHRAHLDRTVEKGRTVTLTFTGNHGGGAICKNAMAYVTPELTRLIDGIAKDVPGFFFGRFDVRFKSLADLCAGRNFKILEINGAGAEAIHIWDADTPILTAYRTLFEQYRQAFVIGHKNRKRGHGPDGVAQVVPMLLQEMRLKNLYPVSD